MMPGSLVVEQQSESLSVFWPPTTVLMRIYCAVFTFHPLFAVQLFTHPRLSHADAEGSNGKPRPVIQDPELVKQITDCR